MPHLIETYALNCGLKIDKPFMLEKFFPIDVENFITIHPNSKYTSKCYDHWQEVVDLIREPLKENNIDMSLAVYPWPHQLNYDVEVQL